MKISSHKILRETEGFSDVLDITPDACAIIGETGIREGQAVFFVVGSTAGITTVEFEPGLVRDVKEFFERLAPQEARYHHERTWHDGNGFSHVRASILKPSLTVPILNGKMTLGTWQQIVLVDFDNGPRQREVVLQVIGE